jgi:uncharacterized membrane protein
MPSITAFNAPHLHLLVNHVPTVGAVVALGLLLLAFARRSEHLTHAGLELLFVIAVLTLPAFISGGAAQTKLRKAPGISDHAVRAHEDAAITGFVVTELAGFVAWIALWQTRRRGRAARGIVTAATALTIVALLLMSRAATLGGDIRHPEIRAGASAEAAAADDPEQFVSVRIANFAVNSPWGWPAAETVHFLGLSLAFGVLLMVNLRVLGVMKRVAFGDVHQLLPWGMLGFGGCFITGMFFFVGQTKQYIDSGPFYWKVVFLVVAGANYLYLTVFTKAWTDNRDAGWDASLADKAMAIVSMFSWLVILYCGRMLPFLGKSF